MESTKPFYWVETAAVLYLAVPLFIFFAFFIRLEIAIPACALIAFLLYELVRSTAWRGGEPPRWETFYFLFLAALWVWLSSGLGPTHQTYDWPKHYSVVNFLTQRSWPPTIDLEDHGSSVLRYYLGWYLVPSLVLKATNAGLQTVIMSAWSTVGVFLFFNLLPELVGRRWAIVSAPLVFMFFGGMDFYAVRLTESHKLFDELPYYSEWWAGWAQFPSNTNALFWVPQHALPAWLGMALIMRLRRHDAFLPYCAMLGVAILLWSPFSAIGLAPFFLLLAIQHGSYKITLDWRAVASGLLLAVPTAMYLLAGSGAIPHGYIGTLPCIAVKDWEGPCFSWRSYFIFLLVEITAPLMILFLSKDREHGFLLTAAIGLCLIPLYKVGVAHDFAMRASLPSLALLAILCAKLFDAGTKLYSTAVLLMLLGGLPTVAGEIYGGLVPREDIRSDLTFDPVAVDADDSWWAAQYFAPLPVWILRQRS